MIHAKTAVVDGAWSRVGSSNLNNASLMGNWELDVGVLDTGLASQLEGLFLGDLATSREIVLPRDRVRRSPSEPGEKEPPKESLDPQGTLPQRIERGFRERGHAPTRVDLAPIVRAGSALGAALAGNRTIGREDRAVIGLLATAALIVAVVAAVLPMLVGWFVAAVAFWLGSILALRALTQARRARVIERLDREQRAAADDGEEHT
jgi:cardiolipin synthase